MPQRGPTKPTGGHYALHLAITHNLGEETLRFTGGGGGGAESRAQCLKGVQPNLLVVTMLYIWPSPTILEKKLYGSLGDLRATAAFTRETGLGI